MTEKQRDTVGGQAVIEGVMIRSPKRVAVAVRRPDDRIEIKKDDYVPVAKRHRLLNLPIIRGGIVLVESLVIGVKAITFSADVAAAAEGQPDKEAKPTGPIRRFLDKISIPLTVLFAFGFGFLVFFYLPLVLTELVGTENPILFNAIDGVFRLAFFLAYIIIITRWKEMRRVFEYHGAEHMGIFTFEAGEDLTVENARKYRTMHPRCGTSFLLFVMLVSVVVFIFLGRPETVSQRLVRFLFVPVIGGISYEITRLSDKMAFRWTKIFIMPGIWLQRLTTADPDDSQLEVALAAIKASVE